MSKFHESGDHGIRHDDAPDELARKLYDDPDYFENNPRGYKHMSLVAKRSQWHDEVVEQFCRVFPVDGKAVLDVGCATGVFMRPFFEHGADIRGLEISKHAAAVAQRLFEELVQRKYGLAGGGSRVVLGSAHDLSAFANASIDLYWSVEVMEHVPYRFHLAMVREAFRVLCPGGVAYWQGQIGFKDYLNPDPNDDAGHIAVLPYGYWQDLFREVGFRLRENDADLATWESQLNAYTRWREYGWRFIFARKL